MLVMLQFMLWATDQKGLKVILDSDAIYDCGNQLSQENGRDQLIVQYELGISRAIMKAGYAIVSNLNTVQPSSYVWENATNNLPNWCTDMWYKERLAKDVGNGLLFYKVSREFPDTLKKIKLG